MAQDPAAAPAPAPKKNTTLVIAILAASLLGAGGAVVGSQYLNRAATADAEVHVEDTAPVKKKGKRVAAEAVAGLVTVFDNIILNPAGSNGQRFLLMSVAVELPDSAATDRLVKRDAQVRDAVMTIVGAYTVEQLTHIPRRDSLKVDLQAKLDSLLGEELVQQVYFPQFVIQ